MVTKYLGLKNANELSGAIVRTVRPLENAYGSLPAGSKGIISNAVGHVRNGNLRFVSDKCSCCGVQLKISGLSYSDFALVDKIEDSAKELLAVKALTEAFSLCGINEERVKFISPIKEIESMGFDVGAFSELCSSSDDFDSVRFAQDAQTGNVYVSFNGDCHDFGVVDIGSISSEALAVALSLIAVENEH